MKKIIVFILAFLFPFSGLGELEAHFLDVGPADCCIIVCDGEAMIIDGGESGDSSLVYSYLKNTLKIKHLKCVIATHPHEDHIGGLSSALIACTVEEVLSPYKDYKSDSFQNLVKYATQQGVKVKIPIYGYSFSLGGARVEVHKPQYTYSNVNDMSLIVRITYGNTSLLFMGDSEIERENDLIGKIELKSDLIKIGHHGSKTSTSEALLKSVNPEIAVISCGKQAKESPDTAVLSRIKNAGCNIYTTADYGHIIAVSDGQKIIIDGTQSVEIKSQEQSETYVLNTNTKKYHLPTCSSVSKMKEANKKVVTTTNISLEKQGYNPCKNCNP